MSATTVLSQLEGLLEKTKQLKAKFAKVYPTKTQWDNLSDLSLNFSKAATEIEHEIQALKASRTERARKESDEHIVAAQALRGDLFARGRLKQPAVFRRNILTIFGGLKDSRFDSEDVKLRKESTRKRCKLLRDLSPDAVVSWAIAFAPTLWAGGSMATDVFTCLFDDIEPEVVQVWPPVIRDTLHLLREDEECLRSSEYAEFLKTIDDPLEDHITQHRKRKRLDSDCATLERPDQSLQAQQLQHEGINDRMLNVDISHNHDPSELRKPEHVLPLSNDQENTAKAGSLSPYRENREMKHMFTDAPASNLSKLPEPFRTAVQNSRPEQPIVEVGKKPERFGDHRMLGNIVPKR